MPVEVGGDAHEAPAVAPPRSGAATGFAFVLAPSVKPPFVLVYTWPVSGYSPQHLPLPSSATSATPISMPSPDASKDAAILMVHECRPLARIGSPNAAAAPPCLTQTAVLPSEISKRSASTLDQVVRDMALSLDCSCGGNQLAGS